MTTSRESPGRSAVRSRGHHVIDEPIRFSGVVEGKDVRGVGGLAVVLISARYTVAIPPSPISRSTW